MLCEFLFFKQKAAYEVRISDWSSDVCSSDLPEEVVWIDLLEPSPEEERFVDEALGLDVPSEEEMQEIEVSSRLYQERNALYMTVTLITGDRKSVVWGKRVEVRVGLGGCCNIKKK